MKTAMETVQILEEEYRRLLMRDQKLLQIEEILDDAFDEEFDYSEIGEDVARAAGYIGSV